MRVVSFNIRSLRDDASAVAEIIKSLDVDVALIQEAPRFLRWRSKIAGLAADAGLFYVTGGRTAAAMAVLCSMGTNVVSAHQLKLPKTKGLHQRGVAAAVLTIAGPDGKTSKVGVASIHLGLRADERLEHAQLVVKLVPALAPDVPWIIAGDLNETDADPAWKVLADGLADAWVTAQTRLGELTYSAEHPQRRIDAIFCDRWFTVVRAGVPTELDALIRVASDHRPVFAELSLS